MGKLIFRRTIPGREFNALLSPTFEAGLDRLSNGATGMRIRHTVQVTLMEKCGNEVRRYIYTKRGSDYGFTPWPTGALPLSHLEAVEALSWLSKNGVHLWPGLNIRAEIVKC